jgi:ribose 1,5-bisphosphokinase
VSCEPGDQAKGCLVLVVGASGAGKDTLIAGARAALAIDQRFLFARRVVTRQADTSEDHTSLTPLQFAAAAAAGAFLLSWQAHGLSYGIKNAAGEHLNAGGIVVCNVSRSVVGLARARSANVRVVQVIAPADMRAARLAARGRESDQEERLTRVVDTFDPREVDFTVHNAGEPSGAVVQLVTFLLRLAGGA